MLQFMSLGFAQHQRLHNSKDVAQDLSVRSMWEPYTGKVMQQVTVPQRALTEGACTMQKAAESCKQTQKGTT